MKKIARGAALSLAAMLLMYLCSASSRAATLVQVSLWDKGADTPMPVGIAYGAPGASILKGDHGYQGVTCRSEGPEKSLST